MNPATGLGHGEGRRAWLPLDLEEDLTLAGRIRC